MKTVLHNAKLTFVVLTFFVVNFVCAACGSENTPVSSQNSQLPSSTQSSSAVGVISNSTLKDYPVSLSLSASDKKDFEDLIKELGILQKGTGFIEAIHDFNIGVVKKLEDKFEDVEVPESEISSTLPAMLLSEMAEAGCQVGGKIPAVKAICMARTLVNLVDVHATELNQKIKPALEGMREYKKLYDGGKPFSFLQAKSQTDSLTNLMEEAEGGFTLLSNEADGLVILLQHYANSTTITSKSKTIKWLLEFADNKLIKTYQKPIKNKISEIAKARQILQQSLTAATKP